MSRFYGADPEVLGFFPVKERFGTYVLYMPVRTPQQGLSLPVGLRNEITDLMTECMDDFTRTLGRSLDDKYIYLSFETSFVEAGKPQKRPGWHCDGFLTDDINYIWYSNTPTVFSRTKFDITQNHKVSMEQFQEQAKSKDEYMIPAERLIRMDQYVVHRADIPKESGIRTFVKVSISPDKYNLKGNTKNPDLITNWKMYDRSKVRNHPQFKEVDSVPEGALGD